MNFDHKNPWPYVDVARKTLEDLRAYKESQGRFGKQQFHDLTLAVRDLHTILFYPGAYLDATPESYHIQAKDRVVELACDYLRFCLEIAPLGDNAFKIPFLQLLQERIVEPICKQPTIWNSHAKPITEIVNLWKDEERARFEDSPLLPSKEIQAQLPDLTPEPQKMIDSASKDDDIDTNTNLFGAYSLFLPPRLPPVPLLPPTSSEPPRVTVIIPSDVIQPNQALVHRPIAVNPAQCNTQQPRQMNDKPKPARVIRDTRQLSNLSRVMDAIQAGKAISLPPEVGSSSQSRKPPKRPLSANSNDGAPKRKKTDQGTQHIPSQDPAPEPSTPRPASPALPLGQNNARYYTVAQEQEQDAQFLTEDDQPMTDVVVDVPRTPVLPNEDSPPPPPDRPRGKAMSPAHRNLADVLTPHFQNLRTQAGMENGQAIPPHIRIPGQVLPPGGNAVGAQTPNNVPDRTYPKIRHTKATAAVNIDQNSRREVVPLPNSTTQLLQIMEIHNQLNRARHVEAREFYFHKRTAVVANVSAENQRSPDGTIRLNRYFSLTQDAIRETKEYLKHITGRAAHGSKTMLRLTCISHGNGGPNKNCHAWPEGIIIQVNGKRLLTSMVNSLDNVAN